MKEETIEEYFEKVDDAINEMRMNSTERDEKESDEIRIITDDSQIVPIYKGTERWRNVSDYKLNCGFKHTTILTPKGELIEMDLKPWESVDMPMTWTIESEYRIFKPGAEITDPIPLEYFTGWMRLGYLEQIKEGDTNG